jgi:lipoprotein NlpI
MFVRVFSLMILATLSVEGVMAQDDATKAQIEQYEAFARQAEEPEVRSRAWIQVGLLHGDEPDKLPAAEAAYDKAVAELTDDTTPRLAAMALNQRGRIRMFRGHLTEALADFDAAIARDPREGPRHWRRGIVLYYVGRFDDGAKQFEGYQTVDDSDVENVTWRMLCQAKSLGLAKAREQLLKVGPDGRIPMAEVYQMFAGRVNEEAVEKAAAAVEGDARRSAAAKFYADLYIGLYADATDRLDLAEKRLAEAVEHDEHHDMWHVARLHLWHVDPERAPADSYFAKRRER